MDELVIEKASKENVFMNFISRHKFISSLILCLIFFLIYLPFNNFHICSGGDDPTILRLISHGEYSISFVGYFFAAFVGLIQPLLPYISFYFLLHESICFLSLAIINYAFLSVLTIKKGLFYSIVFDIIFFSFYIITIQFTNTAAAGITGGFICLIHGLTRENRRKYKILQIAGGIILMTLGSQIRFDPFKAFFVVAVAFITGVFLSSLMKNKSGRSFKEALLLTFKKIFKTTIIFLVIAAMIFGVNKLSDALKYTDPNYPDFLEYNIQLSRANDYENANFFANKDFYHSIGIEGLSELYTLKFWFVDDDFFTTDKLKKIADYSEIYVGDGAGSRSTLHALLYRISIGINERVKNGIIIIDAVIFVVAVFAFWILWLLAKEKLKIIFPPVAIAAIWGILLVSTGGITGGMVNSNLLILPVMVFSVITAFLYNRRQQIIILCLTLAAVTLHTYLSLSRIHFSPTVCYYLPTYTLMIISLKKENLRQFNLKKLPNLSKTVTAIILVITSIVSGAIVFKMYSYYECPNDYKQVRRFINEHPDNVFVHDSIIRTDSNFSALKKEEYQKNAISFGGWEKHSRTYKDSLKAVGIKHLFPDAVDSNVVVILFNYYKDNKTLEGKVGTLTAHYNAHYAPKGKTITFKKIKSFNRYTMYKIVSGKADEKNQ